MPEHLDNLYGAVSVLKLKSDIVLEVINLDIQRINENP